MRNAVWWAVAILLLPAGARADVIGPPPVRCPSGSVGTSAHIGPYCAAVRCQGSGECAAFVRNRKLNGTCQERKLCIEKVKQQGGWAGGREFETVVGSCETGSCTKGACETLRACVIDAATPRTEPARSAAPVAAAPPAAGGSKDGCRCSLDGGANRAGLLVVGLGCALLVRSVARRARGAGRSRRCR